MRSDVFTKDTINYLKLYGRCIHAHIGMSSNECEIIYAAGLIIDRWRQQLGDQTTIRQLERNGVLSTRTANAICRNCNAKYNDGHECRIIDWDYYTIQLLFKEYTLDEISKWRNIGPTALNEIKNAGAIYGLLPKDAKENIKTPTRGKPTQPVVAINIVTGETKTYKSQSAAARDLGIKQGDISGALTGKRSRVHWWKFERVDN